MMSDAVLYEVVGAVANRTHLLDRLEHLLSEGRRRSDMNALLYCVIDFFKSINDSYGHAVGDDVLREFSDRVKRTVRDTDPVARLGGTSSSSSCAASRAPTTRTSLRGWCVSHCAPQSTSMVWRCRGRSASASRWRGRTSPRIICCAMPMPRSIRQRLRAAIAPSSTSTLRASVAADRHRTQSRELYS